MHPTPVDFGLKVLPVGLDKGQSLPRGHQPKCLEGLNSFDINVLFLN